LNPLVVDASVVLKWYFTEAHADLALKVVNYPGGIVVPESLETQVGMALWRRVRANELRKDDAHRVLANLRRLPLTRVPTQALAPAALEIASVTSRTFMESLYFALAIREQTRLVTADRWWFSLLQTGPMKPHLRWIGDVARELEIK
jgi:predicted nucleic acid-binding protein